MESHFNPHHIITAARKVSTQAHLGRNKPPREFMIMSSLNGGYWSYFSFELFVEYASANEEPNVMQLCGPPW